MLGRHNHRIAYDWWWHSLSAENTETGELEAFFIEYYVINPGRGGRQPVFGQIPGPPARPSYAMIKAGKWGKGKAQIHNFRGVDDFRASRKGMDVRIGKNRAGETFLKGSVSMTPREAKEHPEYMTDAGEMSWDLKVDKEISFSVGYGASAPFRYLNLFPMFWHVQGMKVRYEGTIVFNRQTYHVKPESSFGYQDKNWGRDYTNPWIWLNCNCFKDEDGRLLEGTSLDIGGGNPKLGPFSLGEKILVCFVHEGEKYEFNFTRLFFQKQDWSCREDEDHIYWDTDVSNRTHRLKVSFSCPKEGMLLVNYENPKGKKNHNRLWNGGDASGTLELFKKKGNRRVCGLTGERGGCEYGRY